MTWLNVLLRMVLCVVTLLLILWWAESVIPFGSILVFMLSFGIVGTWCAITLMRDKTLPSGFLDGL